VRKNSLRVLRHCPTHPLQVFFHPLQRGRLDVGRCARPQALDRGLFPQAEPGHTTSVIRRTSVFAIPCRARREGSRCALDHLPAAGSRMLLQT
jgi:hypothetical protein